VELLVLWPILCVDDFYRNPDQVIEFANSLDFYESTGKFPGERTRSLHEIDRTFFLHTTNKIINSLYPNDINNIKWSATQYFQKIDPKIHKTKGFIHQDNTSEFTSIIYLTKNLNSGTCFYRRIKEAIPNHDSLRNDSYKNIEKLEENSFKEAIDKNNECFEKTVEFKSLKNRMILFDGSLDHGVENFGEDDEIRLTLVTFFDYVARIDDQPLKYHSTQCKRF